MGRTHGRGGHCACQRRAPPSGRLRAGSPGLSTRRPVRPARAPHFCDLLPAHKHTDSRLSENFHDKLLLHLKKKKVLQDQRERRRNTAPGADTTHTWSRLTDRKTLRAAHEGAVFTRDSALRFFRFSLMSMHYLQNVEKCGTSGHLGPCVHVCVPWDSVLLSACTSPDSGGRRPRTAASRAARRAGCRETGPQARARPS